jgi:hypothetical protein
MELTVLKNQKYSGETAREIIFDYNTKYHYSNKVQILQITYPE